MGSAARKLETPARGAGRERASHVRLVSSPKRPLQAAPRAGGAACDQKRQAATVPGGAARKPKAKRKASAKGVARKPARKACSPAEAASRSAFQVVCVALATLTVLGLVRVALSAKAAEASIDQVQLERSIKAESRVADRLELDKSVLVTPSRITSIAVGMQMTKAPAVRYLSVTGEAAAVRDGDGKLPPAVTASSVSRDALSGALAVAMEVTRREARTLLVGDAAVAAAR